MSKAEFTKGEWFADKGDLITTTYRSVENNMIPICEVEVEFDGAVGVEQKANARLISKAPKLYKMVETLMTELHQAIDEVNDQRCSRITPQTETPPDLWDMETLHDAQVLLAEVRGEL